MFKVFINDGKHKVPNDDIFYIVGKEGLFIKKSLGIIDSITPIDNISILNSVETCARLNINKISKTNFAKMYMFFKDVYKKFQSEAILLIFYNEKTHKYKIVSPKQTVSGTSMEYDRKIIIKDYTMIGDIHSHGTMSAFHSSVDDQDEKSFDGLHITIGHITSLNFSISGSIVINGNRFVINPLDYIEGIQKAKEIEPKKSMEDSFTLTSLYKYKEYLNIDDIVNNHFESELHNLDNKYNFLSGVLEKTERNTKWIEQVTKKIYKRNYYLKNQYTIDNEWYNFIDKNKNYTNNYESINDITNIDNIDNIDNNPCLSCIHKDLNKNKDKDKINISSNKPQIYICHKCKCIIKDYKKCPNCLTIKYLEIQDVEEDQYNNSINYIICKYCGEKYSSEDYKDGCPFCYQQHFKNF